MELEKLSACKIGELIRKREISSVEVTRYFLERIDLTEKKINAFLHVNKNCLKEAEQADQELKNIENPHPLFGVPISIKDNISVKNLPLTCASKILEGYIAPFDATVVERLKRIKTPILGKTNLDEFAMGSSTEYSAFGPTKNPWDTERAPGGSSGGSAASVAAGSSPMSLGSDTGGSIRQPASFCGVVGLKPTYGRVSRYGLVAFGSSLDQIGPITKTVEDAALLLEIIAGKDPMDTTSSPHPVKSYFGLLKKNTDLKGWRIGLPKEYFVEGIDSEIEQKIKEAAKKLQERGAEIIEISLPHTPYAIACYYIIAPAEASSNLARFDGVRYGLRVESEDVQDMVATTRGAGFGPEVKRRILIGTFTLSAGYYDAYYLKAQRVRRLIKEDFQKAFEKVDAILTPTSPIPPFKLGERLADPIQMYLADIFTISANLAGIPAVSVPVGLDSRNLPVGAQIMGAWFEEEKILQVALALEEEFGIETPAV